MLEDFNVNLLESQMNWNAINAISTLGMFLVALFSLFKPDVDRNILMVIYTLFLIFLLLFTYHKLFRLIRRGSGGAVYKINWGIKHWIENPTTLRRLGYTWDDVDNISDFEFNLYPTGKSINLTRRN